MTLEQAIELGRRMMACEGFEWSEGMRALRCPDATFAPDGLVIRAYRDVPEIVVFDGVRDGVKAGPTSAWVPDPRDPGTVGHALAMMWKAAETDVDAADLFHEVWREHDNGGFRFPRIEAVIAAWEALS